MCGFLLFIGKKKISSRLFKEALELQSHRGPDSTQIFFKNNSDNTFSKNFEEKEYNFLIGHNRLSIIDLSEGSNQPVFNKNGKNFLLFNGEFYNFRDFSNYENKFSDTKTLFSGLESEGIKFYEKVNGPWASVYGSNSKIFLSRDRYGKKPIYYYKDDYKLIVSSEIKSIYKILNIKREVNIDNLVFFLASKLSPYATDGTTFYKNINSVKPGENLVYDLDNFKIKLHSNINLEPPNSEFLKNDETKMMSKLENELQNSIDLRFDADAKVGMSLSGGVDSLTILSLMNKKRLKETNFYTIFEDENNEDYRYLKKLKDEMNFKLVKVPFAYSHNVFENYLNDLSKQIEIPVNFYGTAIPTLAISEQMKKDKIKVCIDGIGGDEIMGGYPIYERLSIANLRKNKFSDAIRNLNRFNNFEKPKFGRFLYTVMSIFYSGVINKSRPTNNQKNNNKITNFISNSKIKNKFIKFNNDFMIDKVLNLKESQLFDIKFNQLPYYIGISDSVNMLNSIESRSPFLDSRLYKYVFMDDSLKYRKGFNKYLLRKLLSLKIGNYYGFRKSKSGFTTFHGKKFLNEKKNVEIICDSSFIRSVFSSNIYENLNNQDTYVRRQLLSLAYLDNNYSLEV